MKRVTKKRVGVVAEKDGKYWGVQRKDSHFTVEGFGDITTANISNPKFCKRPTDMTYGRSPYIRDLKQAVLKKVIIKTTYEIEE